MCECNLMVSTRKAGSIMAGTIELSQFDLIVLDAIIKSIYATQELDLRQNRAFTQVQRIGNFTTFLRRETVDFVDTHIRLSGCRMSDTDRTDLKRWLSRLTSTKYWVDVATPDYHGNRYYRSPFQLNLSGTMTKIMDADKMKTLCDLAKDRVKVSPSTNTSGEISSDNFQFRLESIIASANKKVAEANLITNQVTSILTKFSFPTP